MSFEDNQVRKVETILKYSWIFFNDQNRFIQLKGVVGDAIEYPNFDIVTVDESQTDYNIYKVFSSYSLDKFKFEEEDLTINVIRKEVSIPKSVTLTSSNKSVVINSDILLNLSIDPIIVKGEEIDITYTVSYTISDNKYNYKMEFSHFDSEDIEPLIYPTSIHAYLDTNKTIELFESPIEINVEESYIPGGD